MINYNIGDTIEYVSTGGRIRTVVVEQKYEDVKHGHPGFAGNCITPNDVGSVWGYDDQVTRVLKKGAN